MDDNQITYQWKNRFEFIPDMSPGLSMEDKITTINIPLMSIMSSTKKMNAMSYNTAKAAAQAAKSTLFVTKTVREMFFEGYISQEFEILRRMTASFAPKDKPYIPDRFGIFEDVSQYTNGSHPSCLINSIEK